MPSDQFPVYRKTIVPWYDSDPICIAVIIAMSASFLFGVAGIAVAREHLQYRPFVWLPLVVTLASAWILFSTAKRVLKRRWRYKPEELD